MLRLLPIRLSPLRPKFCRLNSTIDLTLTDDETTYVCWHQPVEFPYEFTKPLPAKAIKENTSILKTNLKPELMKIFEKKPQSIAVQELAELTYTSKHRWFPRARDKKAKKTPMDRPYL